MRSSRFAWLPTEVYTGMIAEFGEDGGVVRFEVLRASRVVEDAERPPFSTTG